MMLQVLTDFMDTMDAKTEAQNQVLAVQTEAIAEQVRGTQAGSHPGTCEAKDLPKDVIRKSWCLIWITQHSCNGRIHGCPLL